MDHGARADDGAGGILRRVGRLRGADFGGVVKVAAAVEAGVRARRLSAAVVRVLAGFDIHIAGHIVVLIAAGAVEGAAAARLGLGLPVTVSGKHRAGIGLFIAGGGAVGRGERVVHVVVGLEAGAQLVCGILLHLAARDHDHQRTADADLAHRNGACVGTDVALGAGVHGHIAALGGDVVARAENGAHGVMQYADQRGNGNARGAAARDGHHDAHQLIVVRRVHAKRVRADGNTAACGGGGLLLGEHHIHRAGDAGGAGGADARGIRGDEFLGFGVHRDTAAGFNVRRGADEGVGGAFKIGKNRDGGNRRRAAHRNRGGHIGHGGLAVGADQHAAVGDDRSAQCGKEVVFKYQRAGADRDAHLSAAREAEREQDHGILGNRLSRHAAGGDDQPAVADGGFHLLVIDHHDDGRAYAGIGRCRYRAGDVVYV